MKNKTNLELVVSSSRKTSFLLYLIRIILVICVVLSYFYRQDWFDILVIITLIQIALFPNNFYGAFIENLVEYNTQVLEDRIVLNANETNKYLKENDEFKEKVKFKLDIEN
ncbi:hypothetical protein ACOL3G_07145 [Aliarcobacter butzleri]